MAEEEVILVDDHDHPIGTSPKMAAHRSGLLHRAFSVYVFDRTGRLLLQRRADGKYHSAGLWSNTCCGHPRPGEDLLPAARRRLAEEMGFHCDLLDVFSFRYRCRFDNGLEEHEIDHVCIGSHDGPLSPDPTEVGAHEWVPVATLESSILSDPTRYTFWLRDSLPRVLTHPEVLRLTSR